MRKYNVMILMLSVLLLTFTACQSQKIVEYQLDIEIEGQGSVSPSGGLIKKDTVITFEIHPAEGWVFDSWAGESLGDVMESGGHWKMTMNGDKKLTAVFTELPQEYKLLVAVIGQGAVVPNMEFFPEGHVVTFALQPAKGWSFKEWGGQDQEHLQKINGNWQIVMNNDRNLTASFEEVKEERYSLNVEVQGQGLVSISPEADSYKPGTLVELKANPAEGWAFKEWRKDLEGKESLMKVTMSADKNVLAVFEPFKYKLTLTVHGKGTVEQKHFEGSSILYPHGTIVTLTASPDTHWLFQEWQGDLEGKEAVVNLEMDSDKEVTVIFVEKKYDLTIEVVGEGTVEEELVKKEGYPAGSSVRLKAVPAEGWTFKEWQGDAQGQEPIVLVEIDGAKKVTAIFAEEEPKFFNLDLTVQGEGSISAKPEGDKYEDGTLVQLTAIAAKGWLFVEWQGDASGDDENIEVKMDNHKAITAVFAEINYYNLETKVEGQGSIEIDPQEDKYAEGTLVTLTALAAADWEFVKWQGALESEEASIEIKMEGDKEITAVFTEIIYYNLEAKVEGQGSIEINPQEDKYVEGTLVTLTALADPDWEFVKWQGALESEEASIEIKMDGDKEITAVFTEIIYYNLALEIEGQGTVEANPKEDKYVEGTLVTLTALAEEDWRFVKWQGAVESEEESIEVLMDSDKDITAIFTEINYYELEVIIAGQGAVKCEPELDKYKEFTSITLKAIPEGGWFFAGWYHDASGSEETIEFTIEKDMKIFANFKEIPRYSLNVSTSGAGKVDKDPESDIYLEGTVVTLTAQPRPGWLLDRWVGDIESTDPVVKITMDSNKSLEAIFRRKVYYNIKAQLMTGLGLITVEPSAGPLAEGTMVKLTAHPAKGWSSRCYWLINGEVYTRREIEFPIHCDIKAQAYFKYDDFE